jgi:putative SOS response-associated peptidase YedK
LNPTFDVRQVEPRYNIAPTQPVLTVRVDQGQVRAGELAGGSRSPPPAGGAETSSTCAPRRR